MTPSTDAWQRPSPGVGLPADRGAGRGARRAFIDLQRTFFAAIDGAPGTDRLRDKVRAAEEPVDLWLLHGPLLAALTGVDPRQRARRQLLQRGIESVFPDDGAAVPPVRS